MTLTILMLPAGELERRSAELAGLMHECVHTGASIGFVLPHTLEQAEAFWRNKVLAGVQGGGITLLVALLAERIVGTVQLDHDTPGNQPHRAEVRKLLVHPQLRRQGVAKALMAAVEQHATQLGRSLLTLDTRTNDKAEPLYRALGYQVAGVIPRYCRDNVEARLDPVTIMYKEI